MILTCPACATRYLTDPVALGATGRTVRCARCGHAWHQMPPVDAGPRLDVVSPASIDRPAQAYTPPPGGGLPARIEPKPPRRTGGWLALAAVVVLVVAAGLYLGRGRIVAAWPEAAELYAQLGLPVAPPVAGLALRDISLTRLAIDGHDTVIVEGRILNEGTATLAVPPLMAMLRDESGRTVASWTARVEAGELAAGAAVEFRTTHVDPPAEAERLAVALLPEG
jgi:predicted Zn finger-like uncharacterized protein